ncbi:uncharacterized protein LOC113312810 [Papaver somniferum]|uniref:uncharacterized protein LOC113312810 n=1 Tax=Papaver somniferum TaxID=3469 RepID=UPI000E702D50|nr:uncharacterized protein LOC113312810 [Papaver somniferum]
MASINEFHRKGKLDWRLNMSFLKIIPKEDSATVKDFRPLSLINSFYKILSKLLAERLKVVMPGRLRQKNPGIMCKIDMQKPLITTSGFQVVEGGTVVSRLQFADDSIILLDASMVEVRRLLVILLMFEVLTGIKLNLEKNSMTSIGADDMVEELALGLGCKIEFLPVTYLGMTIGAGRRSAVIWEIIIQRMKKKLAPWKRKYLNKDGRVVLIKSSLEILAVYFMSLHYLPVSVEKRLNTIMRKFLWGEDDEKKKMS